MKNNRIAIVGCGFVADFYLSTLINHPELELLGVTDRNHSKVERFSSFYGIPFYHSFDDILNDARVDIVVNLTNPKSHYDISKAALLAGKHVYSEKPLSLDFAEAQELVELAEAKDLILAGAPCTLLSETAQTVWRAIRSGMIGQPKLVYAELDDGPIHQMNYKNWISDSGNPWPYKDEFEVGCTLEHAGYYVTWLVAFFGPALRVTSFASIITPDKGTHVDCLTPDFSVGLIEFTNGVIARITCGLLAPHNQSLQIVGEDGILSIRKCWDYGADVILHSAAHKTRRFKRLLGFNQRKLPLVRPSQFSFNGKGKTKGKNPMDFARGIAEVAAAINEKRHCRLSARYSLHVNEIVLTLQNPQLMGSPRTLTSSCDLIMPMSWAM